MLKTDEQWMRLAFSTGMLAYKFRQDLAPTTLYSHMYSGNVVNESTILTRKYHDWQAVDISSQALCI